MKKLATLLSLFLFLAHTLVAQTATIQNQKDLLTYTRFQDNKPANGTINLNKNGTFLTQFFGGCDGIIETKGNWTVNKDTLNFTDVESRLMNDPWKKINGDSKFLMNKKTLISFSIIDDKMVLDSSLFYKKVKTK